jgi:hypothetical protein
MAVSESSHFTDKCTPYPHETTAFALAFAVCNLPSWPRSTH